MAIMDIMLLSGNFSALIFSIFNFLLNVFPFFNLSFLRRIRQCDKLEKDFKNNNYFISTAGNKSIESTCIVYIYVYSETQTMTMSS